MASSRDFDLVGGVRVSLVSLRQEYIYAGLIEGLPTRRRNDAKVQRLLREARESDGYDAVLLSPTQTPIQGADDYPFGEAAALPSVACIGRFHSGAPARNPAMDCSDLTIIWFQEDFGFPPSEEIRRELAAVSWKLHAHDREF